MEWPTEDPTELEARTEDPTETEGRTDSVAKKRRMTPRTPRVCLGYFSAPGFSDSHRPEPPKHLCSRCGWSGHNVRSCKEEWETVLKLGLHSLTLDQFKLQGAERLRERSLARKKVIARKARQWYQRSRGTSLLQQFGLG